MTQIFTSIEQVKNKYFPGASTELGCKDCRKHRDISPLHYGPGKDADCGKCIANKVMKNVRKSLNLPEKTTIAEGGE